MPTVESYPQGAPCYFELSTPDRVSAGVFYGPLFGWDLVDMPVGDGVNTYVIAALDGDTVAGIGGQLPEMEGEPACWDVFLAVDDVDAVAAKVEPAGGKLEAAPFDVLELGRMAVVHDPTGARVNLWQAGSMVGTARKSEPGTLSWSELTTTDVELATQFYVETLGLTEETVKAGDVHYATMAVGGESVCGATHALSPGIAPHWTAFFDVIDIDARVVQVLELGGTVINDPFEVEGVGRIAIVADPQGGMFALMEHDQR